MTGKDLLLILGEINPKYYEEGEYQTIGDEKHPRPVMRTLLIAALIALILAVPGCARFLFSPLNGDALSLGGTYRGNGIVTVEVKNGSDKELKFQKQLNHQRILHQLNQPKVETPAVQLVHLKSSLYLQICLGN